MLEVAIRKKLAGFTLETAFAAGAGRLGILGASGSGKSMTLKCIAGIEAPDAGRIVLNGRVLFDSERGINLAPQQRRVGYLFQQYALFPAMTVRRNFELVLRFAPRRERRERAAAMLARMHLEPEADLRPEHLSGGQQQRAALGRMLLAAPEVIMLDEPLSALDSFLRMRMEKELMDSLANFTGPLLFVSHNRDEIYRVCRELAVLDRGAVVANGPAAELFRRPVNLATARLTGVKNLTAAVRLDDFHLAAPAWGITLRCAEPVGPEVKWVGIRAHHIRLREPGDAENCFTFQVTGKENQPFTEMEYLVRGDGCEPLLHLVEGRLDPVEPGEPAVHSAEYHIPPERVMALA